MRRPCPIAVATLLALLALLPTWAHDAHESDDDTPRFRTSRVDARDLKLPEERDRFTFAVFGDRTGGPPEGIRVLEQAVTEVNLLAPDLVMTVGDLIQGYNRTPAWLTEMREFHSVMDRLAVPWFPVAGNHDVYWRGDGDAPAGEHEGNYEKHFAPLWYAFRHRDCWFVALYTDEGDPSTNAKGFNDPAQQRMSPAQLTFLEETLAAARDARHVFVFLHHPRWIGGGYGDDWERVHRLLVEAGNVTAVFAGHIHRMRYDPRDGIEYFTLATVGGAQSGIVPQAGYLHHYFHVSVDDDGIAVASYPVGSGHDPRDVTGEVSDDARRLTRALVPRLQDELVLHPDFSADGDVTFTFSNPTSRPVELNVSVDSADDRWRAEPDHEHVVLDAGGAHEFVFRVRRPAGPIDAAWALPRVSVAADYLATHRRFALPSRSNTLRVRPTNLPAPPEPPGAIGGVLVLDGHDDHLVVRRPATRRSVGPITVEAWFRAAELTGKRTLIASHGANALWLGLTRGDLELTVGAGDERVALEANDRVAVGRWHHVAAVCDDAGLALYLDGRRVARGNRRGCRDLHRHPLLIGADRDRAGQPARAFAGALDDVRVTHAARYSGKRFDPQRRPGDEGPTVLLLHMDGDVGPWVFDGSPARSHPAREGGAHIIIDRRPK